MAKGKIIVGDTLTGSQGLTLVQRAFDMEPGDIDPPEDRIYRLPEVLERTGLKKSSIYAMVEEGRFPPPVQLTPRAIGWHAHEVKAWIRSRKKTTD